jgi:hypothetical protein
MRAGLWVTVSVAAAVSATVAAVTAAQPGRPAASASDGTSAATNARDYAGLLSAIGVKPAGNAVAEAAAALARTGQTESVAAQSEGVALPPGGVLVTSAPGTVGAATSPAGQLGSVGTLYPSDLFVIAPDTLPAAAVAAIGKLAGVSADNLVDAARVEVNGSSVAMLGVDPATFREFAASPTAASTALWQNVADGEIAVSYLMGQQENLPLGGSVTVTGAQSEDLPVGGYATVGISGVDAVVSASVI